MPLKIAPEGGASSPPPLPDQPPQVASRNDASVDSELAALGLGATSPAGLLPNPVFQRFTPILNDVVNPGLLFPARLDAPTASIVRAMIDDSIATEKAGLWGWAWVDGRGISQGGYALGDAWLGRLVAQMRAFGIPVYFDQLPPTFPSGFPITDPAVYYGWYEWQACGPFADPLFQFLPGAVAVHIHSFSAATLRSPTANWCGPLLVKGAAATLGNVYEPYLSLSANLDVFQDRLLHGFTLAESGWMAQPALSWMSVVIGDPLYRPYAAWKSTAAPDADTPWKTLRSVVTRSGGSPIDAAAPLAAASKSSGNSLFLETLGLAQSDAGFPRLALGSFQDALSLPNSKSVRLRLRLETIRALESLGQSAEAGALARLAAAEAGPGSSLFNSFLPPPAPKP